MGLLASLSGTNAYRYIAALVNKTSNYDLK